MIREIVDLIRCDYHSNYGKKNLLSFFITDFFFPNYRFRFLFFLRLCEVVRGHKKLFLFYAVAKFFWHRYSYKAQLEIPFYTVGGGAHFKHNCGPIIINANARVGKKCLLSPGVIIGISSVNRKNECPIIGDNVYLSPNCKIFGKCHIGNNVIIGIDTIVRDMDVPDNCWAVGNPVKIGVIK